MELTGLIGLAIGQPLLSQNMSEALVVSTSASSIANVKIEETTVGITGKTNELKINFLSYTISYDTLHTGTFLCKIIVPTIVISITNTSSVSTYKKYNGWYYAEMVSGLVTDAYRNTAFTKSGDKGTIDPAGSSLGTHESYTVTISEFSASFPANDAFIVGIKFEGGATPLTCTVPDFNARVIAYYIE